MKKQKLFLLPLIIFTLVTIACSGCNIQDDKPAPIQATTSNTNTTSTDELINLINTSDLNISPTLISNSSSEISKICYDYTVSSKAYGTLSTEQNGNSITLLKNSVSSVYLKHKFMKSTIAYYSFDLKITGIKQKDPWNTLYIGLRLKEATGDPTQQSGVWLAVRENTIGIRTNSWPETSYVEINDSNINFATLRRLYIEDDMTNNIISIFANTDTEKRTMLCKIKIENNTVKLYQPEKDFPSITNKVELEISENGYFSIWMHHMTAPAYISKLTATGIADKKETKEAGNMMNSRDVFSDTWVATDDENRKIEKVSKNIGNKKVGVFYFIWHDPVLHGGDGKLYDHSAAYSSGGINALEKIIPAGPIGYAHYWAEPYFGYYRSDDEWVIRKHAYQLSNAGIDFIFIDATNGLTYENTYETIFRVYSEMRSEGASTPQIMFHCGNTQQVAKRSFDALWDNLYSTGRYEELWFKHDGKPLLFAPKTMIDALGESQKAFFTFRQSWAFTQDPWYTESDGNNCWAWADMYPQLPGKSPDGKIEQMIVMSGFWANGGYGTNAGRSYSYESGGQPTDAEYGFGLVNNGTSGKGIAYEEQFNHAIKEDPDIIMLTGWNEWWGGRWTNETQGAGKGHHIANTYTVTTNGSWTDSFYVDTFNPEFSRDIEPVKGYYNDNYYYQTAQNIRDYKGTRGVPAAFGQKNIDVNGSFAQWLSVGPEFRDYANDITHRDASSYVGGFKYSNSSGRNDFTVCKVSKFENNVCFYAECTNNISSPVGTNWMNLFINSDCNSETGWHGYDLIINRYQKNNTCSVEIFVNGKWEFQNIGYAEYRVDGKYIVIKLNADLLGLGNEFDFKWADNSVNDGDIMKFIDLGDSAPNDRFNYKYTVAPNNAQPDIPSILTNDMIVLKAGSYDAFVGNKSVMLDSASTKATFIGGEKGLYAPKEFAEDVIKLNVSDCTVFNHYGTEYVDISKAIANSKKTISRSEALLVISDKAVSEKDMLTLYRALY